MTLEIEICDETIEKLATAIAEKIGAAAPAADDDDFDGGAAAEEEKEITLTDMQDAVKEAVGKHGKDKVKAFVKKASGAEKVVDIPKDKYKAVLDGLKKIK